MIGYVTKVTVYDSCHTMLIVKKSNRWRERNKLMTIQFILICQVVVRYAGMVLDVFFVNVKIM